MIRKYASLEVLDAWNVPAGGSRQVLRKAAHRVAFDYTPRPGYLYVRSRMISSRTNDNHDTFPANEIEDAYRTFLGKPVFVNHHNANHKRARGVIVAVALHKDRNPDGSPDTWAEGLMELDAVRFPKLAQAVLAGRVNRTSMGVDVGWSRCSACGNTATSPAEYCRHMPALKGKKFRARNAKTGKVEEKLIHEVCHKLAFFENSLLYEDPADPTSVVIGSPDGRGMKMTASSELHDKALDTIAEGNEGFSVHPATGQSPSDGYMVAMQHRTHLFPQEVMGDKPTLGRAIHHVLHSERDAFEGDSTAHLGGWVHKGQLWVEPAHNIHDRDLAVKEGNYRNQIAIWDVKNAQEIPTGGTGGGRVTEHDATGAVTGHREAVLHGDPAGLLQPAARAAAGDLRAARRAPGTAAAGAAPAIARTAAGTNAADEDNLYHLTGCHHTSCGRTLHRRRQASVDVIEDRLHHPSDPAVEPVHNIVAGARAYSAKIGLEDPHTEGYGHIQTTPDRVRRLAHAYDALPMNDRNAHRAFHDMARQVNDQYHHLTHAMGVRVEPVGHDPYADHHEMMHDLRANRRLQVLKTAATGPHGFFDDDTNDKFRAVHDAFGHAATGRSFDRHGEEAAWLAHSRMFHGEARHAMTTETRGQNSMLIATGGFPPQKTALLPHEFLQRHAAVPALTDVTFGGQSPEPFGFPLGVSHVHQVCGEHLPRVMSEPEAQVHSQRLGKGTCVYCGRGAEGIHGSNPGGYADFQAGQGGSAPFKSPRYHEHSLGEMAEKGLDVTRPYDPHEDRFSHEYGIDERLPYRLNRLETEAASGPAYPNPGDHPFFQANPVSAENIVAAYHDTTSDERNLGDRWYHDAHHVAKSIAGGDAHKGAGVLSSYSPQTAWPINLFNASRAFQGDPPGPGSGAMGMHQRSAMRILGGEPHPQVLKAPKTADFAHLIEHGKDTDADEAPGGRRRVVVDRHALSTAVGRRLAKTDVEGAPLGNRHYYEHVAGAYRQAADTLSQQAGRKIAPHQVQAAVWMRQIRNNQAEDASARGQLGRGRITNDTNSKAKWQEHIREHHPDVTPENMHYHGKRKVAYGETRVPPQVDTLRMEECPVCGESSVWSGQRCQVCGFVMPPHLFQDPDTSRARQVRDELDQTDEVDLPPDQIGSGQDADGQLAHPDQPAPDGVAGAPLAGQDPGGDEQAEEEAGEEEAPGEDGEEAEEAEAGLICPACGAQFGPDDPGAQEGGACPACGQAPLQLASPQKEQEPSPGGQDMAGTIKAASREALAARLAASERENAILRGQMKLLASLAGVEHEMAAIRRHADVMNPASPVPDPPEAPPTETTEQALAPHTNDDPSRPGTTPGANDGVPAEQTTTALTPGVEMQTPPATQLIDVSAPVTGTNPSQDGGVPIEQRRIETDVRVDPDPLKAHGPGIGGQGNSGAAFPWMLDGRPDAKQASRAPEDTASIRTFASIRLAKLRVQAGLARGDELAVAETIERDATLALPVIEHEIAVLGKVAQRPAEPVRRPAQMQRAAARTAPSLAPAGATAAAYGYLADDLDGADIFL